MCVLRVGVGLALRCKSKWRKGAAGVRYIFVTKSFTKGERVCLHSGSDQICILCGRRVCVGKCGDIFSFGCEDKKALSIREITVLLFSFLMIRPKAQAA